MFRCHLCNKEFDPERKRIYCSDACMLKANAIRAKNRYTEVPKRICICLICNKEFESYKGFQKCCSVSCQRKNNYRNNAEKNKIRRKEEYAKNKEKSKQKNKEYREKHRDAYLKAQNDYHEKKRFGGNRQACFERDSHKCTQCGSTHMIVPHHIDFSGQTDNPNNSLDNLITLCRKCHMKIHDPNPQKPNKIERNCLICGEKFYTVLSRIKDGKGKTCSKPCAYKYISQQRKLKQ